VTIDVDADGKVKLDIATAAPSGETGSRRGLTRLLLRL